MCNCKKCDWPIYTEFAVTLNCPMCNTLIECQGNTVPDDAPIPEKMWPQWCHLVKRFRKPADAGVGDTVKRIADKLGGELFKSASKSLGMPCGCVERQERWNKLYPYEA